MEMGTPEAQCGPQPRKKNLLRYFGPRLFHDVPDSRDVIGSLQVEWRGLPGACSNAVRLFFSLTWLAVSAAVVGAVLVWVGYTCADSQPSSVAGLAVLSLGALLALLAFCLWLALLCGCGGGGRGCRPRCCCCCCCCHRALASRRVAADDDRAAILPADGPEAAAAAAERLQQLQQQGPPLPRFLPPLEPVYRQQSRLDGELTATECSGSSCSSLESSTACSRSSGSSGCDSSSGPTG